METASERPGGLLRLESVLKGSDKDQWAATLRAGSQSQQLIAGCVAVGGTAASIYAGHRISFDVDHVLGDLRERFDEVKESLEGSSQWKTARTKRPVLILGNVASVDVGFRQSRRTIPVKTNSINTGKGALTIPTLAELIGMKAFLAYDRNALRDYLDFAALATVAGDETALAAMFDIDRLYGHLQRDSVSLEVAKCLAKPEPFDLQSVDMTRYKALAAEWHDWGRTEEICRRLGTLHGERLLSART